MNTLELILCKIIATETFPDRGWIGIVGPCLNNSRLIALHTRPEIYQQVGQIMAREGEEKARKVVAASKIPDGYQIMFASAKDAMDGSHAKRLIETQIGK